MCSFSGALDESLDGKMRTKIRPALRGWSCSTVGGPAGPSPLIMRGAMGTLARLRYALGVSRALVGPATPTPAWGVLARPPRVPRLVASEGRGFASDKGGGKGDSPSIPAGTDPTSKVRKAMGDSASLATPSASPLGSVLRGLELKVNVEREKVLIINTTGDDIDLSGCTLSDEGRKHSFVMPPGTVVRGNQGSITVYTAPGNPKYLDDVALSRFQSSSFDETRTVLWRNSSNGKPRMKEVLNNSGDKVLLIAPGGSRSGNSHVIGGKGASAVEQSLLEANNPAEKPSVSSVAGAAQRSTFGVRIRVREKVPPHLGIVTADAVTQRMAPASITPALEYNTPANAKEDLISTFPDSESGRGASDARAMKVNELPSRREAQREASKLVRESVGTISPGITRTQWAQNTSGANPSPDVAWANRQLDRTSDPRENANTFAKVNGGRYAFGKSSIRSTASEQRGKVSRRKRNVIFRQVDRLLDKERESKAWPATEYAKAFFKNRLDEKVMRLDGESVSKNKMTLSRLAQRNELKLKLLRGRKSDTRLARFMSRNLPEWKKLGKDDFVKVMQAVLRQTTRTSKASLASYTEDAKKRPRQGINRLRRAAYALARNRTRWMPDLHDPKYKYGRYLLGGNVPPWQRPSAPCSILQI